MSWLLATWFCIQCLTRFFQHLAISLLELNTFGHAVCTLFIYALWWNKPLDIEEPEMISIPSDKPEVFELLAAMCLNSKIEYGPYKREASTSAVASGHDTRKPIVFTVQYHRVSGEGRFVQPLTESTMEPWEQKRMLYRLRRQVLKPETTIDCDTLY